MSRLAALLSRLSGSSFLHDKSKIPNPKSKICLVERLEDRLALSGFGPDDGAAIVESWEGLYNSVQVRASDQAIVAGGQFGRYVYETPSASIAVERYDAQGNADDTFVNGGPAAISAPSGYFSATGNAITLQSDGKVVVAGRFARSKDWDVGVARLTATGQVDSSFGNGGRTVIDTASNGIGADEWANVVALQSTGKAVVAGYSNGYGLTARLTTSGALDKGKSGFGDVQKGSAIGYHRSSEITFYQGAGSSTFGGAVVAPDDKIITVGSHSRSAGTGNLVVARYTSSGAVDTTFNAQSAHGGWAELSLPPGMRGTSGSEIALQPDGKIVVAGSASLTAGGDRGLVARYNSNGTLDTTFGAGSGYVLLGPESGGIPTGIAIQPDGKILLSSGDRVVVDVNGLNLNYSRVEVTRLTASGTVDTTFGGTGVKYGQLLDGPDANGNAIALEPDGSIIVAGRLLGRSSIEHPILARFYGDNAPASPSGSTSTASTTDATNAASATDAALMFLLTEELSPTTRRK